MVQLVLSDYVFKSLNLALFQNGQFDEVDPIALVRNYANLLYINSILHWVVAFSAPSLFFFVINFFNKQIFMLNHLGYESNFTTINS